LINVSPIISTNSSLSSLGSLISSINPPTIPFSISSSSSFAKYSTAITSKMPGVEIQSVASTLQQVSSPYR
jgi:hypothetical protein